MSLITDTLRQYWLSGRKTKTTPSGWITGDAPCCGDQRQRGGLIFNSGDAVSFHCFNCDFKTSWHPGRLISNKMRKFMRLINISDDLIGKLSLEALKLHEVDSVQQLRQLIPTFHPRALPLDAEPIESYLDNPPAELIPVLEYIGSRGLYLEDYPFYWSPSPGYKHRLIIPFYYQNNCVGYTARTITNKSPRYLSEQQPGYVFNLDKQGFDRKYVIVSEGPIDAISIDGCAIMGASIKHDQDYLLKQLNREIILVPDRDHEGPKTVEQAMELGWSVSMPNWPEGVKDINDAIIKLGRLATLWLILDAKESYSLKITLRAKTWFKNIEK